jgi:alpha-D-ribose 1-methylphosphonate 5-phosphate C-P lyase
VPKLHQAAHLTILSAGREKRIYAVPPHTDVAPLVFSDIAFKVEDQSGRVCMRSGIREQYMNELPRLDGSARYEVSDTGLGTKALRRQDAEPVEIGDTFYVEGRMVR